MASRHKAAAKVQGKVVKGEAKRQSEGAKARKWDLEAASRRYAKGDSLAKVGERYGVSRGTVATRFKKAGVTVRPKGTNGAGPATEKPKPKKRKSVKG